MKRILITGALGQIGTELTSYLGNIYGTSNVLATDKRDPEENPAIPSSGEFKSLDVLDEDAFDGIVRIFKPDTIIHLAALLSATAEALPVLAWDINMNGLRNALEIARAHRCALFVPSSIGCFGPLTPKDMTPQDAIQRPQTMYGVTKAAGEMLCDYYYNRFDVDTRGVRFPGLISYMTIPGGGTTDYAADIYREAVKSGSYACYLRKDTRLDMMYMPDALRSIVNLMEADPASLIHRNAFNITAMSVTPEEISAEILKRIPGFDISYDIDPIRQAIADSWPNSLDDSAARAEWGYAHEYDLESMTTDMLMNLSSVYDRKE